MMTAKTYKHERRKRGSNAAVAALLGVHKYTIDKRERGALKVNEEARRALLSLPLRADGKLEPVPKPGPKPKENRLRNL